MSDVMLSDEATGVYRWRREGDGRIPPLSVRAVGCACAKAWGRRGSWTAIDILRFRDEKIAEQWVCRDELGMLMQLDALPPDGSTLCSHTLLARLLVIPT